MQKSHKSVTFATVSALSALAALAALLDRVGFSVRLGTPRYHTFVIARQALQRQLWEWLGQYINAQIKWLERAVGTMQRFQAARAWRQWHLVTLNRLAVSRCLSSFCSTLFVSLHCRVAPRRVAITGALCHCHCHCHCYYYCQVTGSVTSLFLTNPITTAITVTITCSLSLALCHLLSVSQSPRLLLSLSPLPTLPCHCPTDVAVAYNHYNCHGHCHCPTDAAVAYNHYKCYGHCHCPTDAAVAYNHYNCHGHCHCPTDVAVAYNHGHCHCPTDAAVAYNHGHCH